MPDIHASKQNGNRQQKLFPKLLYIMWHYRAIKKSVILFKSGHSPIITLCKKAAPPRSKAPLQPHIFFAFLAPPGFKKHVASRVLLRVFIRKYLLSFKIYF
jgi:hypothetical protein